MNIGRYLRGEHRHVGTARVTAQKVSNKINFSSTKGNIMGYFSELHYDIQEMFIEGAEVPEIAAKLHISMGKVVAVLNEFGVKSQYEEPTV